MDETDLEKGNVEFSHWSLRDAGWIQRISRGLYEFVEDPAKPALAATVVGRGRGPAPCAAPSPRAAAAKCVWYVGRGVAAWG